MASEQFFTPSGVRLRLRAPRPGRFNWLMLPGGPGIGSESLHELADTIEVPGSIWMVDLPGDGSNIDAPGAPADPYAGWPRILVEAAQALPDAIYIGHSTGGMYLLATPEIEAHIVGMVLISSAPDARWRGHFAEMARRHPLVAVDAASAIHAEAPTSATIRDVAVASAEWNFAAGSVEAGRELLGRMPYNVPAVDWSDRNFDDIYSAAWWPTALPTLIVSGSDDRIVRQHDWNEPRFQGPHILHRIIDGGAHFPWIEAPQAVRAAFGDLTARLETDGAISA
jgi:pimeloyl-ACP methyl ester carboxylesterase